MKKIIIIHLFNLISKMVTIFGPNTIIITINPIKPKDVELTLIIAKNVGMLSS